MFLRSLQSSSVNFCDFYVFTISQLHLPGLVVMLVARQPGRNDSSARIKQNDLATTPLAPVCGRLFPCSCASPATKSWEGVHIMHHAKNIKNQMEIDSDQHFFLLPWIETSVVLHHNDLMAVRLRRQRQLQHPTLNYECLQSLQKSLQFFKFTFS